MSKIKQYAAICLTIGAMAPGSCTGENVQETEDDIVQADESTDELTDEALDEEEKKPLSGNDLIVSHFDHEYVHGEEGYYSLVEQDGIKYENLQQLGGVCWVCASSCALTTAYELRSDKEIDNFDHAIAVVGWDDNFPKENFKFQPENDGAWLTYNSNFPGHYYYVSYDTPFEQENDPPCFMLVTDEYSKVLSYDYGKWSFETLKTGDVTTVANVFNEEGTLKAVGTFVLQDDSDITIKIMDSDLKECLYSQDYHVDKKGYVVVKLDTPMEVKDYAIAIDYSDGAPYEGESMDWSGGIYIETISNEGESFVLVDDKWLDMSEKETWDKLGFETNNACIRALY